MKKVLLSTMVAVVLGTGFVGAQPSEGTFDNLTVNNKAVFKGRVEFAGTSVNELTFYLKPKFVNKATFNGETEFKATTTFTNVANVTFKGPVVAQNTATFDKGLTSRGDIKVDGNTVTAKKVEAGEAAFNKDSLTVNSKGSTFGKEATFNEKATFTKGITVSSDAELVGNLNVRGTTTLQGINAQKADFKEGVTSGKLSAKTGAFSRNVTVGGSLGVDYSIGLKGDLVFNDKIKITNNGDATLNDATLHSLTVDDKTTFKGEVTGTKAEFSDELKANKGVFTKGVTAGNSAFTGIAVEGKTTLKGDLNGKKATFTEVTVDGDVTAETADFGFVQAQEVVVGNDKATITADGHAKVESLQVGKVFKVMNNGNTTVANLTANGTVTGDKGVFANGVTAGDSVFTGITVNGKTTLNGDLIAKAATFNGRTTFNSTSTFNDMATFKKGIEVEDNALFSGDKVSIKNKLFVGGILLGEHQIDVEKQLNFLDDKINRTGALSAALAGLKPMQYDSTAPTQFLGSVARYKGQTGYALGFAHYNSDNVMLHGGVSYDGREDFMGNLGFSLKVGSGSAKVMNDNANVEMLRKENMELRKQLEEQNKRLERLEKAMMKK